MTEYRLLIEQGAMDFIESLDDKSQRICKDNIKKLAQNPYPGSGKGDKEKIVVDGEEVFRLHIGRSFTAFYEILESDDTVRVLEVLPIDEAHDRYGY